MRTRTINIYNFNELDEETQQAAIEKFREFPDLYGWHHENIQSLKGFVDHFNLSSLDWEISLCSYSNASASVNDEDLANLQGIRLWKWLHNCGILRYYNKHTKRHEDLLSGDCPFTGYCFDENLLDAIREFVKKPEEGTTYQELINDCLSNWVKAYVTDWEYAYSDEGIKETIEANEYEFNEDGTLA